MKRKAIMTLTVVLILAFAVATAFAAGNERKGKRVWKKNCRTACHDGSKASDLSPVSKTQSQWKALFADGNAKITKAHTGVTVDALQPADWEDMFEYLNGHALDSDQPETCG
jgi:cytochrome c5